MRRHEAVEHARRLAEEVCRRGNFFIKGWTDAGSPQGFRFGTIKAAYVTTASYSVWFDSLALTSNASKAAFEIRDLCPQPVPE